MKTSEFKNELRQLGYTLGEYTLKGVSVMNENNVTTAWISKVYVNVIDTSFGRGISPKLFELIYKYASTPIAEREDKEN